MITDRLDHLCLATRTASPLVDFKRVRVEFEQLKALATRRTCDPVRPATPKEESSLLAGQVARPSAVNVNDIYAVGLDNVIERELAKTPRALRLSHVCTAGTAGQ